MYRKAKGKVFSSLLVILLNDINRPYTPFFSFEVQSNYSRTPSSRFTQKINNKLRAITRLKFSSDKLIQEFYLILAHKLKCTCKFIVTFLPAFFIFKSSRKWQQTLECLPCEQRSLMSPRQREVLGGDIRDLCSQDIECSYALHNVYTMLYDKTFCLESV